MGNVWIKEKLSAFKFSNVSLNSSRLSFGKPTIKSVLIEMLGILLLIYSNLCLNFSIVYGRFINLRIVFDAD